MQYVPMKVLDFLNKSYYLDLLNINRNFIINNILKLRLQKIISKQIITFLSSLALRESMNKIDLNSIFFQN